MVDFRLLNTKIFVLLASLFAVPFVQAERFSMFDMDLEKARIMRLNMECSNYITDSSMNAIFKKHASLILGLEVGKVEGYKETFDNYLHHNHLFDLEYFQGGYSLGKIDLYMKLKRVKESEAMSELFIISHCEKEIERYKAFVAGRTEQDIYKSYIMKQ